LVVQGFLEKLQPQSDSPSAAKENYKMLMPLETNNKFILQSFQIRAVFFWQNY